MWRVFSVLSVSSIDLGPVVAFFDFRSYKKPVLQKQDWKKTYLFIVTNRSDRYLASRPEYVNYISNITILIIVHTLQ